MKFTSKHLKYNKMCSKIAGFINQKNYFNFKAM